MGITGGLLAQSAGGRDGRTEGEEGAAVERPSKYPARWAWSWRTVGGIKTTGSRHRARSRRHTHIALLCLFPCPRLLSGSPAALQRCLKVAGMYEGQARLKFHF